MAKSKSQQEKPTIRPGVRASEFPQTPQLLFEKKLKKVNILIGHDPAQLRFAEEFFNKKVEYKHTVGDEDVIGKEVLYQVDSSRALVMAPNERDRVGVWSLDPIVRGSAGANALVKYAASILGIEKLDTQRLQRTAKELMKSDVYDVRETLWRAVWLLAGPPLEDTVPWKQPWDDPMAWLPPDEDASYRLNTLYWDLFAYTFTLRGEEKNIRDTKSAPNIAPNRLQYLKRQKLNLDKVEASFYELSQWRTQKYDPYICALKLRNIWQRQ